MHSYKYTVICVITFCSLNFTPQKELIKYYQLLNVTIVFKDHFSVAAQGGLSIQVRLYMYLRYSDPAASSSLAVT